MPELDLDSAGVSMRQGIPRELAPKSRVVIIAAD